MTEPARSSGRVIRLDGRDNVVTALADLPAGSQVAVPGEERAVTLLEAIAFGHKVALTDLAVGDPVVKYGHPIGRVTQPIRAGQWVHSHNLVTGQVEPQTDEGR
jgi:altronate hydrolase